MSSRLAKSQAGRCAARSAGNALEQYLEDLLVEQGDTLPWAAHLEYIDRQVNCGKQDRLDYSCQGPAPAVITS